MATSSGGDECEAYRKHPISRDLTTSQIITGSTKSAISKTNNKGSQTEDGAIALYAGRRGNAVVIRESSLLDSPEHEPSSGLATTLTKEATRTFQAKTGMLAFVVLTGSYIAKCTAKSMHREGKISCHAYRKWKEISMTQPWFCMPIIGAALANETGLALKPPSCAYALLLAGWLTNSVGHTVQLTGGPEACSDTFIPVSYWIWVASMGIGLAGVVYNAFRTAN